LHAIPLRASRPWTFLSIGVAVCLYACQGDAPGLDEAEIIDREVFVAVYVDLRAAALATDEGEITDEARTEVLARHGASEADVLNFAEYHAEDLPFMRQVWDEIEALLEAQRLGMD
jgi:hypothetical protein